jgi:hypothetical protein
MYAPGIPLLTAMTPGRCKRARPGLPPPCATAWAGQSSARSAARRRRPLFCAPGAAPGTPRRSSGAGRFRRRRGSPRPRRTGGRRSSRRSRVDAVAREAAAQAVGAVVHRLHGAQDRIARDPAAVLAENAGDGASGRDVLAASDSHRAPGRGRCRMPGKLHTRNLLHAKKKTAHSAFPACAQRKRGANVLVHFGKIIRKAGANVKSRAVLSLYFGAGRRGGGGNESSEQENAESPEKKARSPLDFFFRRGYNPVMQQGRCELTRLAALFFDFRGRKKCDRRCARQDEREEESAWQIWRKSSAATSLTTR